MLGKIVQTIGRAVYCFPDVPQDVVGKGAFGQLKVALVADYFTSVSLSAECRIRNLTPTNYHGVLKNWQPDLVFVESAFHGVRDEWRYELAQQPWYMHLGGPKKLARLVQAARDRRIPAVFWNKDDGAFFNAFIDVARLFDHVFTTDETCLPRYAAALPAGSRAEVLAMAFQPAFHSFSGFAFEKNAACFVGSYYRKILNTRRVFLDMIFEACDHAAMPLHVFDRNSGRLSHFLEFRYPRNAALHVHGSVPYTETARLYKRYLISLNVNSVTDSKTMCSRRLLEILACGGIMVTNPSPIVNETFRDFCHVITDRAQAEELFSRLRHGPSQEDLDRAEAGAAFVRQNHTWQHRLQQLVESVRI